jgi:hypothetical protein
MMTCTNGQCACIKTVGDPNSVYTLCKYSSSPGSASSINVCAFLKGSYVIYGCGQCENVCPQGTFCISGQCTCPTNYAACTYGGVTNCVDTRKHDTHCGECFHSCDYDRSCQDGVRKCSPWRSTECPWGPAVNNVQPTICVNIITDTAHCGGCWQSCRPNFEKCIAGKCTVTKEACPSVAPTLCDLPGVPGMTQCANTKQDFYHCGSCFDKCPVNHGCIDGQCIFQPLSRCTSGYTPCIVGTNNNVECHNIKTSRVSRGGCNKACNNNMECRGGVCQCPLSKPVACFINDRTFCFNTSSDTEACGGCFNQCDYHQACVKGICKRK